MQILLHVAWQNLIGVRKGWLDMITLQYLSQEAINDIKLNFSKYKKHFKDETNEWFINEFNKHGWLKDSKIQCDDIELSYDEDYNVSDRKNVEDRKSVV